MDRTGKVLEVTSGMEYERPSPNLSVQDIEIIIILCFRVPGEDGTLDRDLIYNHSLLTQFKYQSVFFQLKENPTQIKRVETLYFIDSCN